MDELKTKVLLFGHKNYEEHCKKVFGILKEEGCAASLNELEKKEYE